MKNYKYAIDAVWIDHKNDKLFIEGWAVDLVSGEPLSLSLKENRSIKVSYKKRQDINRKFKIDETKEVGFIADIDGIERIKEIELYSDESHKITVRVPNKNKQKIVYRVDGIEKNVEHETIVRGWCANLTTKENVAIEILEENTDGIEIMREIRVDVSNNLGLIDMEEYGFVITFDKSWENKTVHLRLKSAETSKDIKLEFSKDNNISLKEKLNKVNHLFHSGYEYYKYHGINKTLKRTVSKLEEYYVYRYKKPYDIWISKNENWKTEEITKKIEKLNYQPLISILVPVYNVDKKWLKACIDSVVNQIYTNWELCIVDDNSSKTYIREFLEDYSKEDSRIKVHFRNENGHISRATNDALAMVEGEYVSLLDNDDLLSPVALYKVVEFLNNKPEADFIYSDEDKIDENGKRFDPFFKPDWSPDTLLSQNYICHFTTIKRSLVESVGGFEVGLEGSQDYDLFLKCTEKASFIGHIPEILYHWRTLETSTAENPESKRYAFDAGKKALENALKRRNIEGIVENAVALGAYNIKYKVKEGCKVSIIIPTKDHSDDLKVCIDSILNKTHTTDYEIIIVDNGSVEQKTKAYFSEIKKELNEKIKILSLDIPFNYSTLNNEAVKISTGDYLVLLNNDIEIITDDWLEIMLGYAQQERIGAVGAKLYYKDNTVQHSGVVLGIGGVAGHSHKMYSRNNYGYFSRLIINSNYGAVTAACLMVKKEKFNQVHGLNEENLSVAFNDVDFCIKLLEKGYYNVCLATVEAYHYESKSRGSENTKSKQQRFIKEINYMKETWSEYLKQDPYYNKNLTLHREDFSIRI